MFTASGKAIEFAGFLRAYVEGSDDPASRARRSGVDPADVRGRRSDRSVAGRRRTADAGAGWTRSGTRRPRRRDTPRPRWSRRSRRTASAGRPPTRRRLRTIQKRGYVFRQGKALVPSFTAFAVTTLLRDHFGDYVNVGFTAKMEEDLDEISNGERDWLDFLRAFYRGDGDRRGLEGAVSDEAESDRVSAPRRRRRTRRSGNRSRVRVGRYGPFLQRGEKADRQHRIAAADAAAGRPDGREGDGDSARQGGRAAPARRRSGNRQERLRHQRALRHLRRSSARRRRRPTPKANAKEPSDVKPRRSSLTSGLLESTVTLDEALKLLSLPRELGVHPESGQPVVAGLGRYGPYVKHGDDYRSLESEDDLFTVDLPASLALLAAPKKQGRRQGRGQAGDSPARGDRRRRAAASAGGTIRSATSPTATTNASVPRGADPAHAHPRGRPGADRGASRRACRARAGDRPTRSKGVPRTRGGRARPKIAADAGDAAVEQSATRKAGSLQARQFVAAHHLMAKWLIGSWLTIESEPLPYAVSTTMSRCHQPLGQPSAIG